MNHLTPDELIDAVEETLAPVRRAHLHECRRCGLEVTQLAATLRESRAADVIPEPSPLFWDHFSERVRKAVAAEPVAPRFAHWFEWPVLVPLVGVALLILALASALPQGDVSGPPAQGVDNRAELRDESTTAAIDDDWDLVSELVGDLDIDTAQQAGIAVGPGSAEGIVAQLSLAEQEELVRLLQAELKSPGG
jgi:hypothetical protein